MNWTDTILVNAQLTFSELHPIEIHSVFRKAEVFLSSQTGSDPRRFALLNQDCEILKCENSVRSVLLVLL